jgi:DNA-binding IclR family transcriptional regulator
MPQSVKNVRIILDLFDRYHPEWGVAEVAQVISLPRSNVYNLMASLADIGLLEVRARGRYRIGHRMVHLGEVVRACARVDLAYHILEHLVGVYGETSHFAVLDRCTPLSLEVCQGTQAVSVQAPTVGAPLNVRSSAVGKVLLAYREPAWVNSCVLRGKQDKRLVDELKRIPGAGYGLDDSGTVPGVRCIAVPVRDRTGAVVAALGLAIPETRFAARWVSLVRGAADAAEAMSRGLGEVSVQGGNSNGSCEH